MALLGAIALLIVLITVNVAGVRDRWSKGKALEIHSIGVLPLRNLSGNTSEDYFADGMTEELIIELSRESNLKVISRTSVMQYKKTDKTLPQIARELAVDAIIEGSVLRSGNTVRVTAQLIYAPDDRHLWAQSYEREMQDVLTLQGEVAGDIVRQINAKLEPAHLQHGIQRLTVDPRAYEAYLKGTYYWAKYTGDDLQRSLKNFQQAVAFDPSFAGGYAGLGEVYLSLVGYDMLPESDLQKVETLERKAALLDPALAETHESLAWVRLYEWDLAGAEQEVQSALALNPNSPDVRIVSIYISQIKGNFRLSVSDLRHLRQLDPISPIFVSSLGFAMLHARMPDEAYEFCQDAVDLDRESVLGHWCLGRTFLGKHQPERAIPELRRTVDLGKVSYFRRDLACAQAATGDREPALRLLAEFRAQKDFRLYYDLAALYSALGNRRAALDSLEACYAAHCRKLIFAGIEPAFEAFRSDPEFQNLIRRVTHLH